MIKCFLLISLLFLFQGSVIAESSSLSFYKNKVDELNQKVGEDKSTFFDKKQDLDRSVQNSHLLQTRYEEEKKAYQDLSTFDLENPGAVSFEKLSSKRELMRQAFENFKSSRDQVAYKESALAESGRSLSATQNQFQSAINSLKISGSEEIEIQLQERKKLFEVPQTVTVSIDYFCTEDETFKRCRQSAQERAELSAIEQGAVVLVSSITRMKDLKIESESVKSEVNGRITNKQSVKSQAIMGSEFGGIHYEMIATVQPNLSDAMLTQIKNSIALDVFGKYTSYFSALKSDVGTDSTDEFLAELERENQRLIAKREREEQLRLAEEREKEKELEMQERAAQRQREADAAEAERARLHELQEIKWKVRAPAIIF
ncbi:hypothetical protein OAH87_06035 [Marinomonas sp.]|nr:hypothetical protein [Marinomonas sp.]MDB4838010.1 hypothetical protein [Marinomonas sp.]